MEDLEKKIEPILNPDGPSKTATDELIKALRSVLHDDSASCMTKDYAKALITSVKVGYKIQTGASYDECA